jgi:SEC-C motif-containing protein
MENTNCPCCSGKNMAQCCAPILLDVTKALTAEQLMRSRYSAHSRVDTAYLKQTLHPSERTPRDEAETQQWAKQNTWKKLEIVATEKGIALDTDGKVEFKAYYEDERGILRCHHEKSKFLKLDNQWYYVDGKYFPTVSPKSQQRNDACACGSGKKYKKCCGF